MENATCHQVVGSADINGKVIVLVKKIVLKTIIDNIGFFILVLVNENDLFV